MLDLQLISRPVHYVQGRSIEPIDVIESWSLCHHLACAVKYLARAGRKNPVLEDLKKAEWYLQRELRVGPGRCSSTLMDDSTIPAVSVIADWKLPLNLAQALDAIAVSKNLGVCVGVTQAVEALKAEIKKYESWQ